MTLNPDDVRAVCEAVADGAEESFRDANGRVVLCMYCDHRIDKKEGRDHGLNCPVPVARKLLAEIERKNDEQGNG